MENLKTTEIDYKDFTIESATDSHCVIIYKNEDIVKCIAGDIFKDGSNNAIEKSKKYIDSILK